MADLLYLAEEDVIAAAPPAAEIEALAARALGAIAAGRVQLPPKVKVAHRPDGLANAMPGYVEDGDVLGLKWIVIDQANPARGLPAGHAVVLLADAATGLPRAVLGARALTALRTAATTAVCVRALRPEPLGHVALVGTGVLARSHLAALAVHGPVRVLVAGRSAGSVAALVEWADQHAPTLEVLAAAGIEEACRDAGVVITLVSQRARGCRLDERWLRPDVLLLPLDYGTCVHAGLARGRLLLADDPEQFRVTRDAGGNLRGYRDPDAPSGAYLVGSRPPGGIVVQNLGTAIADLVLADAIVARAREFGRGRALAV